MKVVASGLKLLYWLYHVCIINHTKTSFSSHQEPINLYLMIIVLSYYTYIYYILSVIWKYFICSDHKVDMLFVFLCFYDWHLRSLHIFLQGAIQWKDKTFKTSASSLFPTVRTTFGIAFDVREDVFNNLLEAIVDTGLLDGIISYSRVTFFFVLEKNTHSTFSIHPVT